MIDILNQDDKEIVFIKGDVDHHSSLKIREEIDISIMKNHPKNLQLDFKDVTFMDSSGIGLVMGRYKAMNSIDGDVSIINVPSHIKKVMVLAGLDKIVTIEK